MTLAERLFTEIKGQRPTAADAFSIQAIENLLRPGAKSAPPDGIVQLLESMKALVEDIELTFGLGVECPSCECHACDCECHDP